MKRMALRMAGVLIAGLLLAPMARADDAAKPTEPAKIEALIVHIEQLKDAKFVRNGAAHNASTAAMLMRYRWNKHRDRIKTARDFIRICATRSTTTGKDYTIKFKDGTVVKSGEYLLEQLAKIERNL